MMIAELVADLRTDLADENGDLFAETVLGRCVSKAVFCVARDLEIDLAITAGEIQPTPTPTARELIILLAQIHACQRMRAATANVIDVSSGGFSVNKSRTPTEWANLEKDLQKQYQQRLDALQPDSVNEGDCGMLTPNLSMLVYGKDKK